MDIVGNGDDKVASVYPEIAFVSALLELDVTIWVARRGGDDEFIRPFGWTKFTPDGNDERLGGFSYGDAVCANTGGVLAVVDVDPRNGGDVEKVRALLAALSVRVFDDVITPSGGRHFYVAGHPELPSVHSTAEREALPGFSGVDIQSFRCCVYLPGTLRPKRRDAGYTIVSNELAALAAGDPDGAAALTQWVAQSRAEFTRKRAQDGRVHVNTIETRLWDGRPPDARQQRYLDTVLADEAGRVAATKAGGRNDALNRAAYACGRLVAGAGMGERKVIDALTAAADTCGLSGEDGQTSVDATIASGLQAGECYQRAVPPAPTDDLFDGEPIPLTVCVPIPAFPVDALPPVIADMVNAVAEATQTDPAMAATSALSVLSACNGGCAQIAIRRGWREPLNSYAVTIAAPALRLPWGSRCRRR
jgi:Protein of unknown function (DUF3987)